MESEVRIELLEEGSTTLIMRGLNRQVTNTSILPLLDGFPPHIGRRCYDFVYVPWATNAATNIGLAFVNFESHQFCKTFLDSLHKPTSRKKLLSYGIRSVGQALIQGRGANLQAILAKRGQAGLNESDAPLVFHRGEASSLESVVHREAREAIGSGPEVGNVSMMTIAPPAPEQTPIPRIVTRACGAQSSHRRDMPQIAGTGELLPAAQPPLISSGCSAVGCYGNQQYQHLMAQHYASPLEWTSRPQAPVPPMAVGAAPAVAPFAPGEWPSAAYLQPVQPVQPSQSYSQSGSSHAVHLPKSMMHSHGTFEAGRNNVRAGFCPSSTNMSAFGLQSFSGAGCVPGPSNPQLPQACGMNAVNMAPTGRPAGAGNWWSIAQTPQYPDTVASSLHFGTETAPSANARPRVQGQGSLPHAASRMTWDL